MGEIPAKPPTLAASLRALAADDAADGASAAVRVRLLDEVRRLRHARRRSLMKMSVLASALCVATALPVWHLATRDLRGRSSPASQRLPALPNDEMVTAFFPLSYSTVPMTRGRLVRLEVPRDTVKAFGVDATESALGSVSSTVLADVLVGDDGLARAVRFVRPLAGNRQKETQQ
jgi:hypothetical protein